MEEAKKRPPISARHRGPGPGCYALPPTLGYVNHDVTKATGPAYTFRTRMSSAMVGVDSSPGPRYHVGAQVTRFGRMETPAFSMLGRGRRIVSKVDKFLTPGPGAYSPEKAPPLSAHRRPPAYTMGAAARYRPDAVPAPNSYALPELTGRRVPNKRSGLSYSMSARREPGGPSEDLARSPGPGRYDSTAPDVYLRRQPSFSMQSRTRRPVCPSGTPGPGAYRPEGSAAHLRRAPSFSMGVRHSEFVTPLVLDLVH
ncbi:outer dense fiber protein 3-like protein 2a [Stigmatopora nigra]